MIVPYYSAKKSASHASSACIETTHFPALAKWRQENSRVPGQPGPHSNTDILSQKLVLPVVPATWEVQAGVQGQIGQHRDTLSQKP
jgi:hypothetical protein